MALFDNKGKTSNNITVYQRSIDEKNSTIVRRFDEIGRLYYGQYYGDGFIPMTDDPKAFADYIRHHRFKVICVNDSPAVTKDKYEDIRNHVQAALDEILPNQSSFENNNI